MAGKKLVRLVLEGEHVVAEEALLMERCERIRTVRIGSDGALYMLTDETDGKVLRLAPPR